MGLFSWLFDDDDDMEYKSTYEPPHNDGELVLDCRQLLNGDMICCPLIYRTKLYPNLRPCLRQYLCTMDVETYPFLRGYEEFCDPNGDSFVGARTHEDAEKMAEFIRSKMVK